MCNAHKCCHMFLKTQQKGQKLLENCTLDLPTSLNAICNLKNAKILRKNTIFTEKFLPFVSPQIVQIVHIGVPQNDFCNNDFL